MDIVIKRLVGIYMFLLAIAVAVHVILTPIIYSSRITDDAPMAWLIMYAMMSVAAILALIASLIRKIDYERRRSAGETNSVREYFDVNVPLYVSAVLSILYLINWFTVLFVDASGILLLWYLLDATLVPLLISVSMRLFADTGWKLI